MWGRYNLTMPCGHSRTNQYPTTSWKENPAKVLQFRHSDIPVFIEIFSSSSDNFIVLAPPHKINLLIFFHIDISPFPTLFLPRTQKKNGTSLLKGGLFWPCFGSPGLKTLWTKPSIFGSLRFTCQVGPYQRYNPSYPVIPPFIRGYNSTYND